MPPDTHPKREQRPARLQKRKHFMSTPDHAPAILAHFTEQGRWCRQLGSDFTADMIDQFAADYRANGPIAQLLADWPSDPRADALALRICAALNGAGIMGQSPELAAVYPQASPEASAADIWPIVHGFLISNMDWVRAYLQYAPQTNETARSIALLPGFLDLAARYDLPMNLLELGASAGLNQNWDKFGYKTESWSRDGTSQVCISTDWKGPPPANLDATFNISSRAGCDLNPLDIHDPHEALRLRSYIWPDQSARLNRFDGALKLARDMNTRIDTADASEWLAAKLAARPSNALTIVYHSVFLQYPPIAVIRKLMASIRAAGEQADKNAPLAWLCFEPEALFGGAQNSPKVITRLQTWPGGDVKVCGSSNGHVTWFEA